MNLAELQTKEKGLITKVKGRGAFRKRITEMGFIKGKEVTVVKNAPLKDPIEYSIMGYEISLRRSEASLIEVVQEKPSDFNPADYNGTIEEFTNFKEFSEQKSKEINVALVGNPNAGKTTLFNYASGSKEHVGNYSGVTVDSKTAKFKQSGYTFNITDLPGTYSLTAYTPEEIYVRNYILNEMPDVVINVADASNIERNMYLTTQLIDMDISVILALNMYDELLRKGARLNHHNLGDLLGVPIVPTVSSKNRGITELFDKIIEVHEGRSQTVRHIHINYGKGPENAIQCIQNVIRIPENAAVTDHYSSRYLAIKLLEKDAETQKIIAKCSNTKEILDISELRINKLTERLGEDTETIITDAKYGFIAGALKETYKEGAYDRRKETEIVDTFITHKIWGFPIFIGFMWLMFMSTFKLGEYPMNWIDSAVVLLSNFLANIIPAGMFNDLLVDGIVGGVGGVIIFLPNILILFFFISLMEDTGYMARVAFIMDKIMHKFGLHGKSFIPLIMGFGCNVPAIMSTRTLENRNDRLLTMLINPFMSCSARLPVYVLVIGAVFPNNPGTMLFGIYIFGIAVAGVVAIIFKKTLFRSKEVPFVMELPPYRMPSIRSTSRHMWNKANQYLQKMGGIILTASIIIWSLGYFPQTSQAVDQLDTELVKMDKYYNQLITNANTEQDSLKLSENKSVHIKQLQLTRESIRQENSYIGKIGKSVEPVMSPLGFDWRLSVSILTGIVAKEVVVSTMAVLFQADESDSNESLMMQLRQAKYQTGEKKGEPIFSVLSSLAFLVFILIYFPCVAVIAAINKESGSWKWAAFTVVYTTGLAWFLAFLVYQVGSFFI